MAALKAKQDDLRRLMKERRENLKEKKNKIESPFAKYNSLGQLFCTICNVQIKNNGLWAPHVIGKMHKENALKKKKGTSEKNVPQFAVPMNVDPESISQISEKIQPPSTKKVKIDVKESPKLEPVKSSGKLSLLDAYSSSSSEDESDTPPAQLSVANSTVSNTLPKDFFDESADTVSSSKVEQSFKEEKTSSVTATAAEALPEGFFDDPVLDAKARNIEYKDPKEEEWERYQKAIAEETNVSKTIMEEDIEESTLERDISQIDEQILHWERIKNLESLAEDVKAKAPSKDTNGFSGSSSDELEEDELLDWRSKSIANR